MSGRRLPVALTIAGADSGGGAGVAADLKTFEAHGVWGTCAVVAVTAQNTRGTSAFEVVSTDLVRTQILSVTSDIGVNAAKTGMLATRDVVQAVAAAVAEQGITRLVVDPVFVSKHGVRLLADDAVEAMRSDLLPLAMVVTPNLDEAARLVGFEVADRESMEAAGHALVALGPEVVLVKGGHLAGPQSPDCLVTAAGRTVWLEGPRHPSRHTHGTGCVLSAAICAELAKGMDSADACVAARKFCSRAIAAGFSLGEGIGPVNPGWARLLGP